MNKKRRLIYELNMARHCMMKSLDAGSIKQLGLTVAQLSALLIIEARDGRRMKELAETLMLDKSAVTGLAKRIESKGLITKAPCKEDSRATRLVITEQGKQVVKTGKQLMKTVNEEIAEGFSEDELDTVLRFLKHLVEKFS
jgi:DNA-binding MarR family transcriptional regulator